MSDGPIWVVSDGKAGHLSQGTALARALAERLATPQPRFFEVHVTGLIETFAPRLLPGCKRRVWYAPPLPQQPPNMLITVGRRAALACRLLKRRWPQMQTFQVLYPGLNADEFDHLLLPEHDQIDGSNVLTFCGALTPITDRWLSDAAATWRPKLQAGSGPVIGFLVGGSNAAFTIDANTVSTTLRRIEHWAGQRKASVLATVSRRTDPDLTAWLRPRLADLGAQLFDPQADGDNDNPYAGILALSDALVVTPDSVSMVCEALATGRPVYCDVPATPHRRFARFHQTLKKDGRLTAINEPLQLSAIKPMRETERLVDRLLAVP